MVALIRPGAGTMFTRRKLLTTMVTATALAPFTSLDSLRAQTVTLPSPHLALKLARIFHAVKFSDLPPTAVTNAKMILASTLASAAAGIEIGSARIVRELAKEHAGRPEATLWFEGTKLPITEAARVNAMTSDAAASDDSDLRNVAHTGTALTAVGLALGERMQSSGPDVLNAIVVGYEAAGRFGDAMRGGRPGLHASMIVAFGATVAASKLLRLTPEQMAHAIAMTSVTMGGLLIGTDSWAREYQAGNAALCAVNAALAAQRGFTVNDDILEAKGGFLEVYGNKEVDIAILTRQPGPQWDIMKFLAIKLVPGAHALHSSAEAAIQAAKQGNVDPAQVARILISGPGKGSVTYDKKPPKDMVEAIHSLPYFVASGIADQDFSWVHVTPEKIANPVVARLIALVEYSSAPDPVHYEWNWGGTVTIEMKSGAHYTSTVDAPRGSGPRGIEWSDVEAKYGALMPGSGLVAKQMGVIWERICGFEELKSITEFTRLLH